jgi:hypothetical protein
VADEIQTDPVVADPLVAHSQITVEPRPSQPAGRWGLLLRIAFRFWFVYLTLFCLGTQTLPGLFANRWFSFPPLGEVWPLRPITIWTAAHVFGVKGEIIYGAALSADKPFDWAQSFCFLVLAAVTTAAWSRLDGRRGNYAMLHKWFRLFVRFALAAQMLSYGLIKVIPLQMPYPYLQRLLEPYGNFSPMSVLWSSVGVSPSYEMFAGCAEVLAGLLLLTPRTTTLGALVCLADMIQVFALNMAYDVPVKLFSFHLILLPLFLLAPEARRLIGFFFSHRSTPPSTEPRLFRSARANSVALVLQLVFGFYLAGNDLYGGIVSWHAYGGSRPKPALYGIWDVEQMSVDGQLRPPLLTDNGRWKRVIFDFPWFTQFQLMDDTFIGYGSSMNEEEKILNLTRGNNQSWKASFTYSRPEANRILLEGAMDGHKVQMQLKFFDHNKLTLVNRRFHWIQEFPFQR